MSPLFDDEDDLSLVYKKKNPKAVKEDTKATKKPKKAKPRVPFLDDDIPASPKKKTQDKHKNKLKKPLTIQTQAGYYDGTDTIVVHKSGDYYWNILPEDAERLSDKLIYWYFEKKLGYSQNEIEILRPRRKSS